MGACRDLIEGVKIGQFVYSFVNGSGQANGDIIATKLIVEHPVSVPPPHKRGHSHPPSHDIAAHDAERMGRRRLQAHPVHPKEVLCVQGEFAA